MWKGKVIIDTTMPRNKQMVTTNRSYMKRDYTLIFLSIFLGGFGVHRFYLKQYGYGILYLLFSWTLIPWLVAILDAIIFFSRSRGNSLQKEASVISKKGSAPTDEEDAYSGWVWVGYDLEKHPNLTEAELAKRKIEFERYFHQNRLYQTTQIVRVGVMLDWDTWGFGHWEMKIVTVKKTKSGVKKYIDEETGQAYQIGFKSPELEAEIEESAMNILGREIKTQADLDGLMENGKVSSQLTFTGDKLDRIRGLKYVKGSITLQDCGLNDLGTLEEIEGSLWIDGRNKNPLISLGSLIKVTGNLELHGCGLKELGQLQEVGGKLDLRETKIRSLNKLQKVGGNLNLKDTQIEDFGDLNFVGGNLLLSKELKGQVDLSAIEIIGKVSFWKSKS